MTVVDAVPPAMPAKRPALPLHLPARSPPPRPRTALRCGSATVVGAHPRAHLRPRVGLCATPFCALLLYSHAVAPYTTSECFASIAPRASLLTSDRFCKVVLSSFNASARNLGQTTACTKLKRRTALLAACAQNTVHTPPDARRSTSWTVHIKERMLCARSMTGGSPQSSRLSHPRPRVLGCVRTQVVSRGHGTRGVCWRM